MAPALLSREQRLLLRAALCQGDAAREAFDQWRSSVEFERLEGNSARLVPLLYRNLTGLGFSDPLMGRMKGMWRRVWFQNCLRIHACVPALDALAQAGIPTILLKGAAMVAHWADDVGTRPMVDFDVLVPRPRARDAVAALMEAGWTPHPWRADLFDDADFDCWHGTAFRKDGFEVDLHWRALREESLEAGGDDLWSRAVRAQLAGRTVHVPAPEDHVVHACMHSANWMSGGRIDWIADTTLVVRAAGPAFDWLQVSARAHAQHLSAPLRTMTTALDEAVGDLLPGLSGALAANRDGSLVERLEARLRRQPPYRRGLLGRMLVDLQDFRRREGSLPDRSIVKALLEFGRRQWHIDKTGRVPGYALFVALARPAFLRRLLCGDLRADTLARRDLPDLSQPRLRLDEDGAMRGGLVLGWSVPETGGGRWTDGEEALIALNADQARAGAAISFRLRAFAHRRHKPVAAEVWANDRLVDVWRFGRGDGSVQTRGVAVGADLVATRPVLSIALRIRRPGVPALLGVSDDVRRLGLFVSELRLVCPTLQGAFGRVISFAEGSRDTEALWSGWCEPESTGCWSCAERAEIRFRLPDTSPTALDISLEGHAYFRPRRPKRRISVSSGGKTIARFTLRHGGQPASLRFSLPASTFSGNEVAFTLHLRGVRSPAELGASDDPRPIGLHLRTMRIATLSNGDG